MAPAKIHPPGGATLLLEREGLGLSMIVVPITAAAMLSGTERHSGVAAGVNSTFSRLGSLLAIAVSGLT